MNADLMNKDFDMTSTPIRVRVLVGGVIALLAATLLAAPALVGAARAGDPDAIRIDGDDPSDFSIALSQATFEDAGDSGPTAVHAVLGRDDEFADSLAAGPLLAGGPLLYVPGGMSGTLPAEVGTELGRVLPPGSAVYIAGGNAAISEEIQASVDELGFLSIRLAGDERTATAAAIAAEAAEYFGEPQTILLALAGNWPDAVAGGSLAASSSGSEGAVPILLTDGQSLSDAANTFIEGHPDAEVVVLGGDAVIAQSVEEAAGATRRLAGDTRADTAAAIAGEFPAGVTGASLIQGFVDDGWVRGNAGAALLQPLLLNGPTPDAINAPTRDVLSGRTELFVLGGTAAISDTGVTQAEEARG